MQRVLIANRGEVAVRVARACHDLGLECVAVAPADDAAAAARVPAQHHAVLPGRGARAYLDIAALVHAAIDKGCDAVHPGYGFLSENADFAAACAAAGRVFIGPPPELLRLFGDKTSARALAARLDVAVLPGTGGPTTLAQARDFFDTLPAGRAMMLKALAGGGGRGMRVVRESAQLQEAFERCQAEALAGFGNADLYAEACIEQARHIEVQIVGDGTGEVLALGERECTLQRRHQKLVEFAPSPALDERQRSALVDAARRMAREVRYRGLGTFEFLLDRTNGGFVFIEANPRLQVEHTVTEEVFGIDLVQLQIRLFQGGGTGHTLAELGLAQAPQPRGCAVQWRINAETMRADGDVFSAGGTLTRLDKAGGPGVRVDACLRAGDAVHPGFDSLLAKLVVSAPGADHAALMRRSQRALDEFAIAGVATNLGFLRAVARHDDVQANRIGTRWIDEHTQALLASVPALADEAPGVGLSIATAPQAVEETIDPLWLTVPAPMPGSLVKHEVAVGDLVHAGQPLVVLEAMKMEHVVAAPSAGRVEQLRHAVGDVVESGAPLVRLTPLDNTQLPALEQQEADLDAIRPDLAAVLQRQALTLDTSRADAVAKRHRQGGRTARENVDDLCDPGSFLEYGSLAVAAQRSRRSMDELLRVSPADGVITGFGTVNGALFGADVTRCAVIAYDYTVMAGTQGFIGHAKQDRLLDVVHRQLQPLVLYAEGGGGRPGESDEDLRISAGMDLSTFTRFAGLNGKVPLVGIVHGRCFAGNAAQLGSCDVIIATPSSTIGMGGPAMIEGGGLGVVRPEDVGPVSVQGPNGVIDLLVDDEAAATAAARQYLGYFQGRLAQWQCADQRELRRAVPENRLRVYDIRRVIDLLADTGSVLELRAAHGIGLVTAFIRVEGRPLGLIANNPAHLGGAMDAQASAKAARFLRLCSSHGLPVLALCDTPGFMVGPAAEREALVRHAGDLFVAAAGLQVPIFSVVLRKGYGLGATAMTGGNFHAGVFTVSWPSGEFGGMGFEGAVRLGFRNELAAIADPAAREAEFKRLVAQLYERGSAINTASLLEVDNVIDPAQTRRWILSALQGSASHRAWTR